ncbi:small polyprotein [Papaya comovirus]|nr:small polyprotein [Papaya comovirus]QHB15141.1 small polyprotein [Papaya comovirus]
MSLRAEKYLNAIPPDVLADKAKAYNVSKLGSLKDQLPKASELYANARGFYKNLKKQFQSVDKVLKGGETHEYKHVPIGNLKAGEPVVLSVPIVEPSKLPIDSAESDYALVKGSEVAHAVHVGAIEVIFECFTSPECNIYGGAMFVDSFHENPENAIRALFVTQLCGGTPPRCLFFPNTQAELSGNINERFKLIFSTQNSDYKQGENLAAIKVNVATCGVSLHKTYVPTPFHDKFAQREKASAIQYVGKYSAVVHRSNPFTMEDFKRGGLSFKYGGKEVLKEVTPFKFEWCKETVQTVQIASQVEDGHEIEQTDKEVFSMAGRKGNKRLVLPNVTFVQPQMKTANFENLLDDTSNLKNRTLLQSRIAAGRFSLSSKAITGSVVFDNDVSTLIGTTLRGAPDVRHTYRQSSKIRMILTVNTPITTGIGLMIGYNSSYESRHKLNEYSLASEESAIWNPACEGTFEFSFSPNPCGSYWSYDYLRHTRARLSILVVNGWTSTPTTDCAIAWQLHVDMEPMTKTILNPSLPGNSLPIKRWMGLLRFEQGSQEQIQKMPLSIGAPVGDDKVAVMTMPNAMAAMWNYNIGSFRFEFTKLCSPFIKGTLLAFIAMDQDTSYSLEELQNFPNKIIQFDDKVGRFYVEFDSSHFAQAWSTQISLQVDSKQKGCPYLYVVSKDCVVSTIPGDFVVGVKLLEIGDYVTYGYNPGILAAADVNFKSFGSVDRQRQGSTSAPRLMKSIAPQMYCTPEENCWSEMCTVQIPVIDTSEQNFTNYSLDLISANLNVATNVGNWVTEVVPSPMVYLLKTAAWKKGTLHFKLRILGRNSVKRSDWSATTRVDVRRGPGIEYLNTITHFTGKPHATEINFQIKVSGPNEGFELWNASFGNQLSWMADVTIGSPNQYGQHIWYVKPGLDFEVAGNRMMADLSQQ